MAQKHRAKPAGSPAEIAARIGRELAKGQVKQAFKEAKTAYASRPDEAIRAVLEQASVARVRELLREGFDVQAKAVLQDLMKLGILRPENQSAAAELALSLGMPEAFQRLEQTDQSERSPSAMNRAADIAIARGLPEAQLPEPIRAGASAVQRSLALVEEDRHAEALELLKDIPRQSVWADWKLFVRGWIAFRNGDDTEAKANWQRIAPQRLAHRAAESLQRAAAAIQGDAGSPPGAISKWMNEAALNHPKGELLIELSSLRDHIARQDWQHALELLRRAEPRWRQIDPAIAARVNESFYDTIIRHAMANVLERWSKWGTPPAIDAKWNRARALMSEHPNDFDLESADRFWNRYVDDLASFAELPPAQRDLAQALVLHHLGRLWVAESFYDDQYRNDDDRDPHDNWDQEQAIECFQRALRLAPNLLAVHESLADAHARWGQSDLALKAHLALLDRFPDHVPSLEFIANELTKRQDPLPARDYMRRALKLKPLDRDLAGLAWMVHAGAARVLALQGAYEEARAEFVAAERFDDASPGPLYLAVRRGVFELKAGDAAASEASFAKAAEAMPDPAPMHFMAGIEARRYALPAKRANEFRKAWRAAAKLPAESGSVGMICRMLQGYLLLGKEYPDCHKDLTEVVSYLRHNVKIKWSETDLTDACMLLLDNAKQPTLLKQLIKQGRQQFPKHAIFEFIAGEMEFARGPMQCNTRQALNSYRRARWLAENSGSEKDRAMCDLIDDRLEALDMAASAFSMQGPLDPSTPLTPRTMRQMIEAMCAQLNLDPDDLMPEFMPDAFEPHRRDRG
jgi:tetratricopeptide (TPR) repeat protein